MKDPLLYKMPFGKYKGKALRVLPANYLNFLTQGFAGLSEFPELAQALPKAIKKLNALGVDSDLEHTADLLLNGQISSNEAHQRCGGEGKKEKFDPLNDMMGDFI